MPKQQKSYACSSLHTQHLSLLLRTSLPAHPPIYLATPQAAESYSVKSVSLPSPVPYSCRFKHVCGAVNQARVCQARLPCIVVQVVYCIKTLEWRLTPHSPHEVQLSDMTCCSGSWRKELSSCQAVYLQGCIFSQFCIKALWSLAVALHQDKVV